VKQRLHAAALSSHVPSSCAARRARRSSHA
jgi:hypothetical protein